MQRTYSKIKIDKNNKVEIAYQQINDDGISFVSGETHKGVPHKDFTGAMQSLAVHLAIITEFLPAKSVKSLDTARKSSGEVEKFHVGSFSCGGEDEQEWIILTGNRLQEDGLKFNFNTVRKKLNEDGENSYPFIKDLLKCLNKVKKECDLYLGGKYAPDSQLKMELHDEAAR